MTTQTPAPTAAGAPAEGALRRSTSRSRYRRREILLAAVALAVVAAVVLWLPGAIYYFTFQRPLLARGDTSLVFTVPVRRDAPPAPRWPSTSPYGLPVPPGAAGAWSEHGDARVLTLSAGTVAYERLPRGAIGKLFAEELVVVGGDAVDPPADVAALADILEHDARAFSFSWNEAERARHAALVLCRTLLWEDEPVERFEYALDPAGTTLAAMVVYAERGAKVIRAGEDGVLVINLSRGADSSWVTSAAAWLGEDRRRDQRAAASTPP